MEEHSKAHFILLFCRIAVSLTLAMLGFFLFAEEQYGLPINLLFMGLAYVVIAYDIYLEAFEAIFKEKEFFNEDMLMILASLGAFALRFFGKEHNEFLEGVLVILLFQIGETIQDFAFDKSKDAILDAIDLRKETAHVLINGQLVNKTPEELSVGDVLFVAVGNKVLCDGVILDGSGELDESSLTGESILVFKKAGDVIYSGTVLSAGSMHVRVEKEYSDSTTAKLARLIEEGANGKSHSEEFIHRFAKYYTPIVVGIALLIGVLPPLFLGISDGGVWSKWIYTALAFLVVSCPCAVVISVPLAYFSGLGLASRKGILVKGACYFDALNRLSVVAFDKTGTITKGKLSLKTIEPIGISADELKEILLLCESQSNHPLAESLFKENARPSYSFEHYEELPGKGIELTFEGNDYLCGRAAFLKEKKVAFEESKNSETVVYLARNGSYLGYCGFADEKKENAPFMIVHLKGKNIRTLLLSGDKKENVQKTAEELAIDEYEGEMLPETKIARIEQLKKEEKGKVAYLGDGINDAPSLAASDVGIAMGGLGSDLAIANADCVLLNDDPRTFISLLKVARKTESRAKFNVLFSLSVKLLIVGLAVLASIMGTWELPLWVSVAGDSGLAVLAILSSLQLQFFRVR